MKVTIELTREELVSLIEKVQYYKRIEEEYLSDNELQNTEKLISTLSNSYSKVEKYAFDLSGQQLVCGKLYHMITYDDSIKAEQYIRFDRMDNDYIYINSCVAFSTFIEDKKVINFVTSKEHRMWGPIKHIVSIEEVTDEHAENTYDILVEKYADNFRVDLEWEVALQGIFPEFN